MVTGARGLLGSAISEALDRRGIDFVALSRAQMDVTRPEQVNRWIADIAPDVVVHCAAYTAVDRAESEKEQAFLVNERGTRAVADATRYSGAHLLAVSTDFVFDGNTQRPYRPADPTSPLSVYGASKLAGEHAALHDHSRAAVVRTSALFGPGGRDFTDVIIERAEQGLPLRVVADQTTQPTFAPTLAETLIDLGVERVGGIWHASDRGPTTWYDFARTILDQRGLDTGIEPVTTKEWAAPAARPLYSVLDVSATERRLGRDLPDWRETLPRHLGSKKGG